VVAVLGSMQIDDRCLRFVAIDRSGNSQRFRLVKQRTGRREGSGGDEVHAAGKPHANRGMRRAAQPGAFDKRPDGERGAGQINRPEVNKTWVLKTLRPRKPCQEPKNTEWLQPAVFVYRFRRESPAGPIPAKL